MSRSLTNVLLLYFKALLFWIFAFGAQSVGYWLTANPEDYLVTPGPLDDFIPVKDPSLFLLWCMTIVPLTAVMFRRTGHSNDNSR